MNKNKGKFRTYNDREITWGGGKKETYLDVLEVKHVPFHKSVLDLLVGPRYEQLVVMVGLPKQERHDYKETEAVSITKPIVKIME